MNILGIETSCDETAAAVVQDGHRLLSSVVASQTDLHAEFGGVVPEVAARSHIEQIIPVIELALKRAFGQESRIMNQESSLAESATPNHDLRTPNPWNQINAIAVTTGPGLVGSLLIGALAAKTLAVAKNKPLISINHVEAHTYAHFIGHDDVKFPVLSLVASGGHTELSLFRSPLEPVVLGATLDDAAGETFDKVAKLLGLPYPGGPALDKAAQGGDPTAFKLPDANLGKDSLDFSFSGLKTAVLRTVLELTGQSASAGFTISSELTKTLDAQQIADLAASFQATIVKTLVKKLKLAHALHHPATTILGGGVAANKLLRIEAANAIPNLQIADFKFCTDNAAMIASLGYFQLQAGHTVDPMTLGVDSSWELNRASN